MGSTKLQNQDFFYGGHSFLSPKNKKEHIGKFKNYGLVHIKYSIVSPIILYY
jgi:hypothetical protein